MAEVLQLHEASFGEVKEALELAMRPKEVFYRTHRGDGDPVLFRGQHYLTEALHISQLETYGSGAYGANVPSSTALYAGRVSDDVFGIAAYALPDVQPEDITVRRIGSLADRVTTPVVFFKPPMILRMMNRYAYPKSHIDQDCSEHWALIRAEEGKAIIKNAQRIAWLGKGSLGPSRWFD